MSGNLAADAAEDRIDRILAAVRRIPEGHVSTYGDVSPGAPRQAGKVLSMAIEDDLPWWRVVRADGSLSQGDRQRKLLLIEDVPFRPGLQRVDMRAARVFNP
ncbi:MAG: MGMT family protein [Thermoleophilaceae bacterium]|nr:MGMT family protein [Thermoleophilaceae bacterium]